MNKVLLSSRVLHKTLERFLVTINDYEEDDLFSITCMNRQFGYELIVGAFVGEGDFNIEIVAEKEFTFEYSFKTLNKLKKLLSKVSDQPLVLLFSDDRIVIKEISV